VQFPKVPDSRNGCEHHKNQPGLYCGRNVPFEETSPVREYVHRIGMRIIPGTRNARYKRRIFVRYTCVKRKKKRTPRVKLVRLSRAAFAATSTLSALKK